MLAVASWCRRRRLTLFCTCSSFDSADTCHNPLTCALRAKKWSLSLGVSIPPQLQQELHLHLLLQHQLEDQAVKPQFLTILLSTPLNSPSPSNPMCLLCGHPLKRALWKASTTTVMACLLGVASILNHLVAGSVIVRHSSACFLDSPLVVQGPVESTCASCFLFQNKTLFFQKQKGARPH